MPGLLRPVDEEVVSHGIWLLDTKSELQITGSQSFLGWWWESSYLASTTASGPTKPQAFLDELCLSCPNY